MDGVVVVEAPDTNGSSIAPPGPDSCSISAKTEEPIDLSLGGGGGAVVEDDVDKEPSALALPVVASHPENSALESLSSQPNEDGGDGVTLPLSALSPKPGKNQEQQQMPPIPAATPRDTDEDGDDDYCTDYRYNSDVNREDHTNQQQQQQRLNCGRRIRLGICAIDKKARSRPMAEILSRLDESLFAVVFFGDAVLCDAPAADWPVCDVLIAFYSKGYPLQKAKDYVALRQPFVLNDLEMQQLLQDRRRVYDLLEASGIDVPRHVYLSRDGYVSTGSGDGDGTRDREVQEFDDHIVVSGVQVHKPFVEKPVNAEGNCAILREQNKTR